GPYVPRGAGPAARARGRAGAGASGRTDIPTRAATGAARSTTGARRRAAAATGEARDREQGKTEDARPAIRGPRVCHRTPPAARGTGPSLGVLPPDCQCADRFAAARELSGIHGKVLSYAVAPGRRLRSDIFQFV